MRYHLSQHCALPPHTPAAVLDSISLALDAEDAIVATYRAAVEADLRGPRAPGSLGAALILRMLDSPDATLEGLLPTLARPAADAAALRLSMTYGILPFGLWTVSVALTHHHPTMTPEASTIMHALGAYGPTPWHGLVSLSHLSNDNVATVGVDCQCSLRAATLYCSNIERATNVASVRSNRTSNWQNSDDNSEENCMHGALGCCCFAKVRKQKANLQYDVSEE